MTEPVPAPAATAENPPVPAPTPSYVEPPRRRGRGLGTASFVLGLLALLGNAIFAGLLVAAIATFNDDVNAALGLLAIAFVAVVIVFWGGLFFGTISIVLGIAGLIRGSGRVLAVIGIVLSIGVVALNLLFGWGLITGGESLLDQFTSGLDET